jgi:transposase
MKPETGNQTRRKYDEQFKLQALKMIDNGQSIRAVAEMLGVGENLLHKWKAARNQNRLQLEAENAELKTRLRQVEQEHDILKKALSIFSRQT